MVGDPTHDQKLFMRESGDPVVGHDRVRIMACVENSKEYTNNEQLQEVGQTRNTWEVFEQT